MTHEDIERVMVAVTDTLRALVPGCRYVLMVIPPQGDKNDPFEELHITNNGGKELVFDVCRQFVQQYQDGLQPNSETKR